MDAFIGASSALLDEKIKEVNIKQHVVFSVFTLYCSCSDSAVNFVFNCRLGFVTSHFCLVCPSFPIIIFPFFCGIPCNIKRSCNSCFM